MPNDPGVRNVDWQTYKTTVDAVEALSGYDLLALLPDKIELAVESGTHAPVAAVDALDRVQGVADQLECGGVFGPGRGRRAFLRVGLWRRVQRQRRERVTHLDAGWRVHRAAHRHRTVRP